MKVINNLFYFIFKCYLGAIFIITAIIFYPFLAYTTTREKYYRQAFKGFVIWSNVFRFFAGWRFKVIKKEPIPEGPYIIVANHASYADIFLIPSLFSNHPHVFLGKSEILTYPLVRTYFKSFNIPVFRDNKLKAAKSLIHARKKLQNGWSLIIFPEGGIPDHKRPEMLPFKDGAFKLAKDSKIPILPVTFVNNYQLFTDPTDFFGSCHPGVSKIVFHPVISIEEINDKSVGELNEYVFNLINSELNTSEKY